MPFAVGLVHADEVAHEEGGFVAAGAGVNLNKAWQLREWVNRDKRCLDVAGKTVEIVCGLEELLFRQRLKLAIGAGVADELLEIEE